MPLGRLKVGSVASDRTGLLIADPRSEKWARPAWVESERITSFVGQPLVFRDETLGVLAVFRREPINEQEFRWLRMFADQAASAIANARAFSELERLRQQLESQNVQALKELGRVPRDVNVIWRTNGLSAKCISWPTCSTPPTHPPPSQQRASVSCPLFERQRRRTRDCYEREDVEAGVTGLPRNCHAIEDANSVSTEIR
jgi:hypothetical protein